MEVFQATQVRLEKNPRSSSTYPQDSHLLKVAQF